ncbi:hypothetical protein SAMN05443246_2876 [Paenibacillus sp. GP183]|nr:hypothetical protein SAMN05443246_2876 [Paenibacillus sp. GP183]
MSELKCTYVIYKERYFIDEVKYDLHSSKKNFSEKMELLF